MKLRLSRISPLVVCCAMAAILAAAYGIWGYLDYFVPADSGCSGDPVCIAEITAGRRADFLVTNLGMLLVFIMSFGVLLLGFGAFFAIRDRWSWRT